MKCKILSFSVLMLFFLSMTTKVQASDKTADPIVELESLETKADFEQAYETLKHHVDQLKIAKNKAETNADKELVKKEIKKVKKEIKAIKAKALSGGIYIGSGALIIILLLIILL